MPEHKRMNLQEWEDAIRSANDNTELLDVLYDEKENSFSICRFNEQTTLEDGFPTESAAMDRIEQMEAAVMDARILKIREIERAMVDEHGFMIRYVFETEKSEYDGLANIYTVGLPETQSHPNIQVVLPLPQKIVHGVISSLVHLIKGGQSFKDGDRSFEVLDGMWVSFKEFENMDQKMIRLMLPDPEGHLPEQDGCDEMYKRQLETLNNV